MDHRRNRFRRVTLCALSAWFCATAAAQAWNPIEAIGEGIKHVAGEATKATSQVVEVGRQVVEGAGKAVTSVGEGVSSLGGDVGQAVGSVLQHAGKSVEAVGDTTANFIVTGVTQPSRELVGSLSSAAVRLSEVDPTRPETFEAAARESLAAASAIVLNAERTLERAAIDSSSLGVGLLPDPVAEGVRHASGEVIRELEKKNPQVAEWLRRIPGTSNLYNYLHAIGAPREGCNPSRVFDLLRTKVQSELDSGARWASFVTTPAGKGLGISGWTPTSCRATAVGIVEHDAAYSADDLVTIDVRLVSLSVGGHEAPSGRFLRIEVLPIGRAHDFVRYHRIKKGETILVSGPVLLDNDLPKAFPEIHPIDDLEVIATPKGSNASSEAHFAPEEGHFVAPHQGGVPLRFVQYEVREGDSLESIAKRFYGTGDWPTIYRANRARIVDVDEIHPGWWLSVPVATKGGLASAGAG